MVNTFGRTEPLGLMRGVMEFVTKRVVRRVCSETWIDELRRDKCIIVNLRGIVRGRNDYDKGVIEEQPGWQGRSLLPPGARAMRSAIVKCVFDDAHDGCNNVGAHASAGKTAPIATMRPA
jgi:hypothetical protein